MARRPFGRNIMGSLPRAHFQSRTRELFETLNQVTPLQLYADNIVITHTATQIHTPHGRNANIPSHSPTQPPTITPPTQDQSTQTIEKE